MISLKTFEGGKRRPLNLFFAEIIIALLFFSISGAVILKVFSEADLKSRQSEELERVIIFAQTFAEAYSESGNVDEAVQLVIKNGVSVSDVDERSLLLEDGRVNMHFYEERTPTGSGDLSKLTMTFDKNDREIYKLECSAYISESSTKNGGDV